MPSKVPFQVVYSSSADDNHREKELEVMMVIVYLQLMLVQTSQGILRSPSHELILGEVYVMMFQPVKFGEFGSML